MHVITVSWLPREISGNICGSWSFVAGLFDSIWNYFFRFNILLVQSIKNESIYFNSLDAAKLVRHTMQRNTMNSIWVQWFRPHTPDRPTAMDYRLASVPNHRTTHGCSCHRRSDTVRRRWSTVRFPSLPCTPASWRSQWHNWKWSPPPNCSAEQCEGTMRRTVKPIS